jgi:hypothetical protein
MEERQRELLKQWLFKDYLGNTELDRGASIGKVVIGEVISTEAWLARFSVYDDGAAERYAEEYQFGDYSPNKYAWQITSSNSSRNQFPLKEA